MVDKIYRVVAKQGNGTYFTFEDNRYFSVERAKLPDLSDDDEISFYYRDEERSTVPFRLIKKFQQEGINNFTNEEKVTASILFSEKCHMIDLCPEQRPAEMHFEDVTEEHLLNFYAIKDSVINDREHGLWAFHGLRIFRFYIKNMHDLVTDYSEELETDAVLVFNKKDNINIEEIRMEKIWAAKGDKITEYFLYVDTNILGNEFDDENYQQRIRFSGSFEVSYSWESRGGYTEKYSFPVKLIMQNTKYDPGRADTCVPLETTPVSIDFGTSSTCVAVKNGMDISLLTLSSEKLEAEDGFVNRFENPTNIMIYRWERIYEQWKLENEGLPMFFKGDREEEKFKKKEVEFDFGYTVKDVLEDAQNDELDSVLTQIKLIPYFIEQNVQLEVNPLIKENIEVIKLVNSPQKQNIECFDPIAFYGYLIGRAINSPANGKIYTNFDITYPVKFNTNVRNKLRESLEYGLKRSLPLPLREAKDRHGHPLLTVNMQFSEPVAYIGAVCGKYLKLSDKKPELFAVYDLGGGTMDFSFGMFRYDGDDDVAIDIFGVDGNEKVGGESLISLISFWIYSEGPNKKEMINNCIPFEVPIDEKIPEDFPDKLLNNSAIAKANVRKINELFSRKLFENRGVEESIVEEIYLFNEDNDMVNVSISVDYFSLKDKLTTILEKTIEHFKTSMIINFEQNKELLDKHQYGPFDVKKVNIFKSGNASRSTIVEEKMVEYFPDNKIQLIDEAAMGENKRHAITPKTAVAFGQLRLRDFTVNESKETPFKWFVYSVDNANGNLVPKLNKNRYSDKWVKFGTIRGNIVNLHYSESPKRNVSESFFTIQVQTSEFYEKADFYIRVFDPTAIEYCVCENGSKPDVDAEPDKTCTVELKLR